MKRLLLLINILLLAAAGASALPAGHFATSSVLASGRWVKVAVPSTGLYRITAAQLRSWGFSSPESVRVYGYGGRRMNDELTAENYIDDLPLVQTAAGPAGIVFYAVGPEERQRQNGVTVLRWSPYTTAGYYFLSESGEPERPIDVVGVAEAANPATTFTEVLHHEVDAVSPGNVGPLLVGEDFRLTPARTFNFATPGRVPDEPLWLQCSFVANTPSAASYVEFTVNGQKLDRNNSQDAIPALGSGKYQNSQIGISTRSFEVEPSEALAVQIRHTSPSSSVYNAWLNYLTINYQRQLSLPSQSRTLEWTAETSRQRLDGGAGATVWDVTDPLNIHAMRTGSDGRAAVWTNDYTGARSYAAFTTESTLPSPEYVETVECSDLHALSDVDMVIFASPEMQAAAERIAAIHRAEAQAMNVAVVDPAAVYNEFGSGAPDVGALRKFLKMLYDRSPGRLRYALLMGRQTIDHRRLTTDMQKATWPTLPGWVNRADAESLSSSFGFVTDDFIAMLEDGSGTSLGGDNLCVAVGRIPATSANDAASYVDKLEQYLNRSTRSPWRNSVLTLADDGDGGDHTRQVETFVDNLMATPGQQHIVTKVHTDAYDLVNGKYSQARDDMMRALQEGTLWWTYVGHGSDHSLTDEGLITYPDLSSLFLRNVPMLYAATCDFMRWDGPGISGGEMLLAERNGGCIAVICPSRPVYIYNNGNLTAAMGKALAQRDTDGNFLRAGDIYRVAKNNIYETAGTGSNRDTGTNRCRYHFSGDPAMRLLIPSHVVRIDSIDGVPFDPEEQPTLAALQQAVISGHIEDGLGQPLTQFDGTATIELYDAEYSMTTNGNNNSRPEQVQQAILAFENTGKRLLTVAAPVSGGRFNARVAMPADVSDNFRPATLNVYATTADNSLDAVGVTRDLYVYGIDDTAPADTEAPAIDSYVLNHSSFRSGDAVPVVSPMVLASVSDNVGINISSAGLGHQIVLTLDSCQTFSDVAMYYSPHPDGTPGGTISYPMDDLEPGLHSLRLRVWDTSGNATESTIEFFAEEGLAPRIFDLYSDANPASTSANFYITHDVPDAIATVTVTVYNLLGNPVWTRTERGRSDMFTTTPVTWDLRDGSGRRVQRGIYIYSATITVDGTSYRTEARKLAVTAY